MKKSLLTLTALLSTALCSIARAGDLDLPGVWNATATMEDTARSITWTFAKEGDTLTAHSKDNESGDERDFDRVTLDGNKVTMEIDFERDGNSGVLKVVAEKGDSGKLGGNWSIVGADGTVYAEGAVTASKKVAVAYAGEWMSTAKVPDGGEHTAALSLSGDNAALKGAFTTEEGTKVEIDNITTGEKHVRFAFDITVEENSINVVIEAALKDENTLSGVWIVKGEDGAEADKGEWTAVRAEAPDFAGEWNVSAVTPEGGEHQSTLTLARDGDTYTGKSKSDEGGEHELTTVAVEGSHLVLTLKMERDGQSGTIKVDAERKEDGSLDGRWSVSDAEGTEIAGEKWKATRP